MPDVKHLEKKIVAAINDKNYAKAATEAESLTASHPLRILSRGLRLLYTDKLFEEASAQLRRAYKLLPNDSFVVSSLAEALTLSGSPKKGISVIKEALSAKASHPDLEVKLSMLLLGEEQHNEAIDLLQQSIHRHLKPHRKALGFLYFSCGQFQNAAKIYRQLTLEDPRDSEAFFNLGCSYLRVRSHREAELALKHAELLGFKNKSDLYSHLGIAVEEQNRPEEARSIFERCIKVSPPGAAIDATYHLALNYLRTGRLKEGFNLYDARFARSGSRPHNPPPNIPWWDGEDMRGRLLLWSEQGIGDQILYSKTFPWLTGVFKGNIDCIIEERLISTIRGLYPSINFVAQSTIKTGDYDFHLPTGSIPRIIFARDKGATWLTPEKSEYDKTSILAERIKQTASPLRVGISWFSSNKNLGGKNIDLVSLSKILSTLPCPYTLVNLQYDSKLEDIKQIETNTGVTIQRASSDNRHNINELTEVIKGLDLVISISNTTVHISGLMGVPTIMLSSKYNGRLWYWEQVDDDSWSRWYPSVKLITQQREGDWSSVVDTFKEIFDA